MCWNQHHLTFFHNVIHASVIFYTILQPEQANLPNPMYCIHLSFFHKHVLHPAKREGGTFLLRGVTRVPVGPLGRRMVEAVDQLSCKIEKIGVRSRVRWSRQCQVPPGSRVTATVLGAGQQLGEAWRRASSAASSFGHGRAGLRWQWWWRSGDGDGTAPANFSSLTMYYVKSSAF
jgi:hypothetical protein